jgi:hypothetical protein
MFPRKDKNRINLGKHRSLTGGAADKLACDRVPSGTS